MRGERGAATVFGLACLALLVLVGSALCVVAAMLVSHRAAQGAADLAALAGAGSLADSGNPCAVAGEVATANGSALTDCSVRGRDVLVTVRVTGPRWLGQVGDLEGRARAGPATRGGE